MLTVYFMFLLLDDWVHFQSTTIFVKKKIDVRRRQQNFDVCCQQINVVVIVHLTSTCHHQIFFDVVDVNF